MLWDVFKVRLTSDPVMTRVIERLKGHGLGTALKQISALEMLQVLGRGS